jgi:hypothetical protein
MTELYFPDSCISIQEYLNAKLGYNEDTKEYFWSYRPISPKMAAIIIALTKQERICYIEQPDELSPHLINPLIWSWGAWKQECDSRNREKIAAHKRRVQRFIDEANSKIVGRVIAEFTCSPYEDSLRTATIQIARGRLELLCKTFKINKIITKESEL